MDARGNPAMSTYLFPQNRGVKAPSCLEIVVREPDSQRELLRIRLDVPAQPALLPGMQASSVASPEATAVPPSPSVAGRIESVPSSLSDAVAAFAKYMGDRRKKQRSIQAFRGVLERAIRECGWTTLGDYTFSNVTEWLGSKREGEQPWRGTTYNRNLSIFRSFGEFLATSERLPENPMQRAFPAQDDGEDGARAATLDEVRAVVFQAWLKDQTDGRCKGNRALYWMCLAAHACRVGEPSQWKRRHLMLDAPVPFVWWTKELNKNNKQYELALAPELAAMLREHLAQVDLDRAESGLPPAGPDDPVFPVVPFKGTFKSDRDAAGIPALDYRQRAFTPHSFRKFFSTELTARGVAEKMVDRLMRHKGRTEYRYYDPPLDEQAKALAHLPRIWPDSGRPVGNRGPIVDNPQNSTSDLTTTPLRAEDVPASPASQSQPASTMSRAASPPLDWQEKRLDSARDQLDAILRAAFRGRRGSEKRVQSRPVSTPETTFRARG